MEALEDLSNDGVVYAELRFAPLVHCQKGLTPIEVVDSVVNGIKDGMEKYNIVSGVILCGMRQEDDSQEVVDLCIEHKDVIGFDLAGPEIGFSVLSLGSILDFWMTSLIAFSWVFHISTGSCSTHPSLGKI